jgi:lipopolysaccharide export LptBFGC system permease protein LptF
VSRLRISAAIPPLLHVLSWTGTDLPLFFNIILPFTLWSVLLSLIGLREHNEELPTA